MLTGRKVRLRAIDIHKDAELFTPWLNDFEVMKYLGGPFTPHTKDDEKRELREILKKKDMVIFAIETLSGGNLIGSISLMGIDHHCQTAISGTLIGDKRYWRQGYATDAKMVLLEYAFKLLNLRRISTRIISDNIASIRAQEKCGYVREGVWKKIIFVDGKYRDMVLLAVFRKGWMKRWREYTKK